MSKKKDQDEKKQYTEIIFDPKSDCKTNVNQQSQEIQSQPPTDKESVHQEVQHENHVDFLVDGKIYHKHDDHWDIHGYQKQYKYARLVRRLDQGRQQAESWFKEKDSKRFIAMVFLTGGYMFVELVVSIRIGSIALQADALHMLSDVLALMIGFYATYVAKRQRSNWFTYGWARAETTGAIINCVFLLANCFNICLEAIHRFTELEEAHEMEPKIDELIIVAAIGLFVNIIGMFIFHPSHDHGDEDAHSHGHSHGNSHGHSEDKKKEEHKHSEEDAKIIKYEKNDQAPGTEQQQHQEEEHNLNIRAVFMHVAGDALGSIGVMISAFIIKWANGDNKFLADPICSLCIVCIIIVNTIPIFKRAQNILMQATPPGYDVDLIQNKIKEIQEVEDVHDFHIWQMNGQKIITTAHIKVSDNAQDHQSISDRVKLVLHEQNLHYSTIQIEKTGEKECREPVCLKKGCEDKKCCQ